MFLIWVTLLFAVKSNNAETTGETPDKTAEAGLCVVIPCSFSTGSDSTPKHIVWFKCEQQRCSDSDVIFDSNKNIQKIQSGFKGRVSLLEPDLSQKNCSIIINDLTVSDTGSYQFTVQKGKMRDDITHRATITVQDLTQKPTVTIPTLTEGQQSTLTCTAPGLCSGSAPQITWTWRGAEEQDSYITGNITKFKTENLTAVTQRHSSTLTFNPSAEHHDSKVTCKVSFKNNITTEETVTLNVTYVKKSGTTTVTSCDTLTCNVLSDKTMNSGTETGSNTDAETVKLATTTATMSANVTKTSASPEILNSSGCTNELNDLTCMCISRGFPLPTIKWTLLENHIVYSVITAVSNHTVKSTVTLAVKDGSHVHVQCVSKNENGEVNSILNMSKVKEEVPGQIIHLLGIVARLEVLIAFLVGALLSAIICCLAVKCNRKKQKTYGYLPEALEMVTCHEDPLIGAGQAVEDDQAAEAAGAAVAAEKQDVEYSHLDFSLIKGEGRAEAGVTQRTPETEYAEIKKEKAKARQEGEEEEEEMVGGDQKMKDGAPDEEEGESEALYSTVKDVMDEI